MVITVTSHTLENLPSDQGWESRTRAIRLLVIPLLVWSAWVLEIFLLEGNPRLFQHPDPSGIFVYTVIGCIVTGIVIPVICIHKTFVTGAVNMYQLGFRYLRRTLIVCSLTGIFGIAGKVLLHPFGGDMWAFCTAFLLLLPTAIASVMICWVLIGTHVQAFVRDGGALFSISVGVVVTSLVFVMSTLALTTSNPDLLFRLVCTGLATALFFFAIRDVYATVIVVTECGVFTLGAGISSAYLHSTNPAFYASPFLAMAALIVTHWYLSRRYTTIVVPSP